MPFAYYGAKHGLASKYPRPRHPTIVEPFAGSAAYSVYWAAHVDRIILYDADPAVVALWERVLEFTDADLDAITRHIANDTHTTDPIVGAMGGSSTLAATLSGKTRKITPRMRNDWMSVRRRIARTIPHLHKITIGLRSYADTDPQPDATYFVDPPYQPHDIYRTDTPRPDQSGRAYRHGAETIDYDHLAEWCRTRPDSSFVIVCEQSPARWLPFAPITRQGNGVANSDTRTEVVWRSDIEVPTLFDEDPT